MSDKKLISFIMFSRNLNIIKGFLDNIETTVKNPAAIELLLKLDDDQVDAKSFIEEEVKKRPFTIKYIITSRLNGLTSLWLACNELFLLSSKESYFVQSISDEVRFETHHWDDILKKYIGFFKDHVFRLRMSTFKLNTYAAPFMCNVTPDSFPIYTRQWLLLTRGFGSCCWASDTYHQFIAYHLSLGEQGYNHINTPLYDQGIFRDVPLLDIQFSGLLFGQGVSSEMMKEREKWMTKGWARNLSHHRQEHFSYLAKRISSYIWAHQHDLKQFTIKQSTLKKTVQVIDKTGTLRREVSYQLPRLPFYVGNAIRKFRIAKVKFGWYLEIKMAPTRNALLKRLNMLLDKCFPYQEARLFFLLLKLPLPPSLKSLLKKLLALNKQMPVHQYGRIQKNTALFFMTLRIFGTQFIDQIETFMIGSPPGLSLKNKFLKFVSPPKWPKSLIQPSKKELDWACRTYKQQNEIYTEMENATQCCDEQKNC